MMQSIIIELDSVSHENQIWFTSKHLRGIYYDLLIMVCRIKYWYQERQLQIKNAKQNRKDNSSHFSTQRHWSHAIYVQKCHIGNSNNSKFTMACKTTVVISKNRKVCFRENMTQWIQYNHKLAKGNLRLQNCVVSQLSLHTLLNNGLWSFTVQLSSYFSKNTYTRRKSTCF